MWNTLVKFICSYLGKRLSERKKKKHTKDTMCSTISAKLLLIGVAAIVLTGQMSNCDNVVAQKVNASNPVQSGAVDAAKKSAEPAKPVVDEKVQPQPVKPVIEEKLPQPIQDAAAPAVPAVPAVVVADVNANKYARGNLLNNETEIPGTIQTAFYVFVAFGLVVIFYISYRSYR